jgi:signal peptidase II
MTSNKDNTKYFYSVAILLVLFDQVTKICVKGFNLFGFEHEGMSLHETFNVIGDIVQFTFVENAGMAFGIEFGVWKIILSLFSVAASIMLIIFLKKIKDEHWSVKTGVTLILAGAFGNLIDRVFYGVFYGESDLFYGRVVDFIMVDIPDIHIPDFISYTHFPVFNVADSCVTCGVVLLLIFHKHIPDLNSFKKKPSETE